MLEDASRVRCRDELQTATVLVDILEREPDGKGVVIAVGGHERFILMPPRSCSLPGWPKDEFIAVSRLSLMAKKETRDEVAPVVQFEFRKLRKQRCRSPNLDIDQVGGAVQFSSRPPRFDTDPILNGALEYCANRSQLIIAADSTELDKPVAFEVLTELGVPP